MEILEVTPEEFGRIVKTPYHVFGSGAFNELNKSKCQSVHYFLFKENKYRLGFVCGVRENALYSPFSAPFGGFLYIEKNVRIQYIDDAIELLSIWIKENNFHELNITLPPLIYNEGFISKQANSLHRKDFKLNKIDLNYYFSLESFNEDYLSNIWYNARKNLKISFNKNLRFTKCDSIEDKKLAYDIIKENRKVRGFPLSMTWEQVFETITLVSADFFIVQDAKEESIASAIVFDVHTEIVQVIYWGDIPVYSDLKTMNYLSYKVFEYYKKSGKKIVDIGPSTENSIPNYGLCEFKESIGCNISPKFTYKKVI